MNVISHLTNSNQVKLNAVLSPCSMVSKRALNRGKCRIVHTLSIECLIVLATTQGNGHLPLAFLDPDNWLRALSLMALLVSVVCSRLVVFDWRSEVHCSCRDKRTHRRRQRRPNVHSEPLSLNTFLGVIKLDDLDRVIPSSRSLLDWTMMLGKVDWALDLDWVVAIWMQLALALRGLQSVKQLWEAGSLPGNVLSRGSKRHLVPGSVVSWAREHLSEIRLTACTMIHYFLSKHANLCLNFFIANLFNGFECWFHRLFQLIELEFNEIGVWESLFDLNKDILEDDHQSLL